MRPIPGVHFIQGDFFESPVKREIEQVLGSRRVGLLLSDMAPSFTGNRGTDADRTMNLCEDVLAFSEDVLAFGGNMVVKFFMGGAEPEFRARLRERFERVVVEKPEASRKHMPRFLSRAGTHIDDLERQLARVGSADDDDDNNNNDNNDDAAGSSTKKHADTGETTPLLKANRASQSMVQLSVDQTTVYPYDALSSVLNNTQSDRCHISTTDLPPPIPLLTPVGPEQAAPRKLGTWDGVFLPVMLSIWGILVYVRMGYFLGQIGVIGTIGSFVCGYLVTTMTTLSISAISTNGTVKGGGPYYMLSRSLGPEFGGSIGLMFYAGTLLS
ncbi:hypothetical protein LPJ66_011930, partial [Kickxella alabastrina]